MRRKEARAGAAGHGSMRVREDAGDGWRRGATQELRRRRGCGSCGAGGAAGATAAGGSAAPAGLSDGLTGGLGAFLFFSIYIFLVGNKWGPFCGRKTRLGIFLQDGEQLSGFDLPRRPDRWAQTVRKLVNHIKPSNQCSASRPSLKSGSYVSLCPKMVVSGRHSLKCGSFASLAPEMTVPPSRAAPPCSHRGCREHVRG
jgi:hypothetical protein